MIASHDWRFPLPRTHTGMLQGNALLGAMIWGGGSVLKITLNRADLWDHRGGLPWTAQMNYAAIRRCLESRDEAGLRRLFEQTPTPSGVPQRPSRLPVGRIELDFGPGAEIERGTLTFADGQIVVVVATPGGAQRVRLTMPMDRPALLIECDGLNPTTREVTAWTYVGDELAKVGFAPPSPVAESASASAGEGPLRGWVQPLPADPTYCVGWVQDGDGVWLALERGADVAAALQNTADLIARTRANGAAAVRAESAAWWQSYWRDVPEIELPNERLAFAYRYGMYKFAGLTQPGGVPATLQGPWVEEYQMPPWQSDYHFNINVQECYWPAYRGNRLAHLRPLFKMIEGWLPELRQNAKYFLGIDDGIMLPHAVDDRCTCMGGFWSGTVDHGCTAWVAEMMVRYARYSGDRDFLRRTAYPFMAGAMRVYEEMLEERDGRFVLPVSVSPEYRGARFDAWGADASFQLACIHNLCEALEWAAAELGEAPKPIWSEIRARLPKACVSGEPEEILLWEGTPLEESHRHHSHLAGLVPFDVIDADDPAWQPVVRRSLARWIRLGMGMWSGWCLPWAAMLHTRVGNADAAELMLELWDRIFTNEGHGTLHDANVAGLTLIGCPPVGRPNLNREKMQMDAGMAATAAVMELMVQTRRGVDVLFAGAPEHWERVSFSGIRTEGGFVLSAMREAARVSWVRIESTAGGRYRLRDPWSGQVREVTLPAGASVTLKPPK